MAEPSYATSDFRRQKMQQTRYRDRRTKQARTPTEVVATLLIESDVDSLTSQPSTLLIRSVDQRRRLGASDCEPDERCLSIGR